MKRKASSLMLGALLCVGCHSVDDTDIAAIVYDQCLYRSDLEGIVPPGTSPTDSITIVTNYINQWIQQQVVLEKAKKNITNTFESELKNYKNSLITYEYESQIVSQLLDTNVSNDEIEAYYDKNKKNFVLRRNIVKMIYVKLPNEAPVINKIKAIMSKRDINDDDIINIQKLAMPYTTDYAFDTEKWIPFYQFQSLVPVETFNEVDFILNHKFVNIATSDYTYLANIIDNKTIDDISPLDYEYDNIRTIILNQRKIDIVKNMQRDLLKEAYKDGKIEIR